MSFDLEKIRLARRAANQCGVEKVEPEYETTWYCLLDEGHDGEHKYENDPDENAPGPATLKVFGRPT